MCDALTYTLNGNQMIRVDDLVSIGAGNDETDFKDAVKQANEYTYDANGNLTKDLNKGITGITYNCLNLPNAVTFSDGSTITYIYSADGTKLCTVHKIGSVTATTDYCGNVIYENNTAKLLLTGEGYISLSDKKYHYYLQDHQGNNRVVVDKDGNVKETNHYYPFGGVFASSQNVQPYKYNGKELDTKKGLNWYDYGAREYDAVLGRWHVMDPSSEKYYGVSPYTYCNNNPVKNVDLDGRDWYIHRETGELYFNSSMNQEEIEYNNRSYARIGGNDMLGDMQDITEKAYSFDESSSLAENNGYSINPTQEIKSEVSREQPYSTGKKTITVTTGEVEIVNEQYGIFPANKTKRISVKTNSLFTKKVSKMDILDAILTGSKKTDEIKRNYYTYSTSTSGDEAQRVLGNIYGVAETIMTGKHDYRNVTTYKDWNTYSKAHKGNGRMLKYRR